MGALALDSSTRMNILFISPVPPSPRFSGSGTRAFNTLRALASCGQVTLLAAVDAKHQPLLEDCRPWCEELFAPDMLTPRRPIDHRSRWGKYWETISTLEPPLVRHYDLSKFSRAVRDLSGNAPALVWVFKSWLAGSLPPLDWQRVVVDFDDLLFRVMRRTMRHTPWYGSKVFVENIEIWKQERFERSLCQRAAQVLVCSEGDRRVLGHQNVRVLPNCVDAVETPACEEVEDADRLLFIGKMDSEPNVDAAVYFCKSILPHILKVRSRAHVYIVGREPPGDIRALHNGTHVFVTGAVADATPYFNAAGVVIVPLRAGGGTRVKILEAFAHQKAVVSTAIGSEGLAVKHGVHLFEANTPREFAARCVALMSDGSMRKAFGIAGRELVESHYSQAIFQRTVRQCVSDVTRSLR